MLSQPWAGGVIVDRRDFSDGPLPIVSIGTSKSPSEGKRGPSFVMQEAARMLASERKVLPVSLDPSASELSEHFTDDD